MSEIIEFLPFIIPLALAEYALLGYAIFHIMTHKSYKHGSRLLWLIVSCLFGFVGPILYFILGKEDN